MHDSATHVEAIETATTNAENHASAFNAASISHSLFSIAAPLQESIEQLSRSDGFGEFQLDRAFKHKIHSARRGPVGDNEKFWKNSV